jgi:hypothetical protein
VSRRCDRTRASGRTRWALLCSRRVCSHPSAHVACVRTPLLTSRVFAPLCSRSNLGFFMVINFIFEFSRGGVVYPETEMSVVNQEMFKTDTPYQ